MKDLDKSRRRPDPKDEDMEDIFIINPNIRETLLKREKERYSKESNDYEYTHQTLTPGL